MPKSGACHLAFFRSEPSQRDGRSEGDALFRGFYPGLCRGQLRPHGGGGGIQEEDNVLHLPLPWWMGPGGFACREGRQQMQSLQAWGQGTHTGARRGGVWALRKSPVCSQWAPQHPREEGRHSPLQGGQVHLDRALSCHIPGALSPPLVCVCHPHTTPPAPHTPLTPMTFWNDCFSPWVRGHTVDSWPDTSRQTCLVKVIFEKHESNINAQET